MVVGGGPVPAMIAFLLGAIFLVPIGAVFGELTAAIPHLGRHRGVRRPQLWAVCRPTSPAGCSRWATASSAPGRQSPSPRWCPDMFGGLPGLEWLRAVKLYTILGADVYLIPTIIALGFAAYVIFLNFRGASSAAKLQAFLTKRRCSAVCCSPMGISIFTGSPDNAMPVFLAGHQRRWRRACKPPPPTSLPVLFRCSCSRPFFYAGFDTIPQQAEEAAEGLNWKQVRQGHLACSARGRRLLHGVHLLLWHQSCPGMTLLSSRFRHLHASRTST